MRTASPGNAVMRQEREPAAATRGSPPRLISDAGGDAATDWGLRPRGGDALHIAREKILTAVLAFIRRRACAFVLLPSLSPFYLPPCAREPRRPAMYSF